MTSVPITINHIYENKVQASSDVFNFPDVSEEDIKHYGLFDYPDCNFFNYPTMLGYSDNIIQEKLEYLNASLGPRKQLRLWVLIFKNKTIDSGKMQENYWKGGNKNEFIFCIGINDNKEVQWGHVFSWTEKHDLKIEARNMILSMGQLDLQKLTDFIETEVANRFVRKSFKEFNYLEVEPSVTATIVSYIIILLLNVGMGVWIVNNDIKH